MNKTLVAGWFSFEEMGASAGDLLARDLACEWLAQAAHNFDIAVAPPFVGGVDWRTADPAAYSSIVFVCGPFGEGEPLIEFLEHFKDLPIIGLNLTMLDPIERFNPFSLLLERDSNRAARPDIAFLSSKPRVPVVGSILIDDQPEYRERARQAEVHAIIEDFLHKRGVAVVQIDTRLDANKWGLSSPEQIESLIAKMDVVVTTRLHGTVLSLKNGVPTIAIDSVAGGAKVCTQAKTIGWPLIFLSEELTEANLAEAFDYCLTEEARAAARGCADRARASLSEVRARFISEFEPS